MPRIFFALVLSIGLHHASLAACESSFAASSWNSQLREKLQLLDPSLEQIVASSIGASPHSTSEPHVMAAALVTLKTQEFLYSDDYTMRWPQKSELSTEQVERLRKSFGSDYQLESLSSDEMKQFYVNHVRQIYLWLGDRFITATAASFTGQEFRQLELQHQRTLSAVVSLQLGRYWLDRSTSPTDLVSSIEDLLENGKLRNLWLKFVDVVVNDTNHEQTRLIVEKAKDQEKKSEPICCKSSPGCRTCPLNLGSK